MFLVLAAALAGAGLALLLRGGTLGLPSDLRAQPVLALGLAAIVLAEWVPGIPGKPGIYIVGTALLAGGLLQNLHFSGAFVTSLGLLLTGFVVLINGYLPLRAEAAEATNIEATGLRQMEDEETRLGILGDVVPLPIGPWVVSFGDLIAAAGAFILGRELLAQRAEEGLDADEFLEEFLRADRSVDLTTPPVIIDLTDNTAESVPPPPLENDRYL
ncbi:MAG: DUF5317 family protein [Acidimicrobiales bacterium]|nr:DUF5317 family protein [Acidimicrobiales bacterium]